MPKPKKIAYNVLVRKKKAWRLIACGLQAKAAIQLATRVYCDSGWSVDVQVVPVFADVYASLQTCTIKNKSKERSFF